MNMVMCNAFTKNLKNYPITWIFSFVMTIHLMARVF